MSFPYKTISDNVNSLNTGSFYDQADLDNIYSGSIIDKYYGASEQDIIEFSVYDIDGNLQSWNVLPTAPIYNVINKTYKDVDQNTLEYNYKQYNSGYLLSFNEGILLDTLTDLSASNVQNGNTVVSYNFLRNIGGTSQYPLIIKNISPSRREVLLIPAIKTNPSDEIQELIGLEYLAFSQKKLLVRDIIPVLTSQLKGYQIYTQSKTLIENNSQLFDLMRQTFGFKTNIDVIKFLNDTYIGFTKPIQGNDNQIIYDVFDGILGYLTNWLYTSYKNVYSVKEIESQFQYIINKATILSLNKINSFFSSNENTKLVIVNFITNIFYDNFVKSILDSIEVDYNNKFFGYFQNALNFGTNTFLPILNYEGYVDNNGIVNVIVKLQDYLPKSYGLRDRCWISNISLHPILQKVILDAPVVKKRYKIAGPNFKVKINNYTTKPVDYHTFNDLNSTETNTAIDFYKKLTELNVDYNNFSNFIVFSSAELRIKLFLNKYNQINNLQTVINQYTSASLSSSSALSSSYNTDITDYKSKITSIYNTFDGYEVYLNNFSSSSLAEPNITYYINTAIEYDKTNTDSLTNNTPQFILMDEDNNDYLIFLSMIGHYFDNLYLYLTKFPTLQFADNVDFPNSDTSFSSGSNLYISAFANNLLEQFGWNPISSFDSNLISETYLTGSNGISNDEKLRTIWNRILQNLPILYKTKGTEECVRLLANIYGIPHSLLNIKEFGGNNISQQDQSSYIFDQKYYFTKYQGNNELLLIPTPVPLKSFEFKFRVDPNYSFPQNTPIKLAVNYTTDWNIYLIKTIQDKCGKIIVDFITEQIVIDDIPIFNGKIYNVLLCVKSATEIFDAGAGNPSYMELRVTCIEDDRAIFDTSKKILFPDSLIQYFYSSSTLYIGNYDAQNKFYGNIDKINVWSSELTDDAFLDHARNFDAYNNYTSSTTYSDLYFRYSLDYPINLSGSNISIANANKYYKNITASAFNFTDNTTQIVNCQVYSSSLFPYQFDEIDTHQNIKLDNLGPNKYKNLKINKVEETPVSRLMPNERSVVTNTKIQDSNLVGVYIAPFKVRDDDILNFLGNTNLMDMIGSPNELYADSYEELRKLRNFYNTNNLSEKVLYQEFLTLYKHYFDGSFFETTKQLFPVRTKIIDGILIEPSVIERSKYQNKPIDSGLYNDFNVLIQNNIHTVTGSNIEMLTSNIILDIAKNGNETTGHLNNYISNYISDEVVLKRRSIFVINGNYTDKDNTGSLQSYVAYISNKNYILNINDITSSKKFNVYNFNLSGSSIAECDNIDSLSYLKGHLSIRNYTFAPLTINKLIENSISSSIFIKSHQTIYTTVNDQGILDGSLPVEISKANKDINQISLTTS